MELLDVLKKSENIRKIFGKRELVIIEKQLNGVGLSASEKTRLSRDIRKKLIAIKELVPYVDDFSLKHGEITKRLIGRVVDVIQDHEWFYKVDEIILFGSLAENRFHLFSDIDICVKFKKDLNRKDSTKFRVNILGNLPKRADVQVYNVLPDKIRTEIDKNGRRLYKGKD